MGMRDFLTRVLGLEQQSERRDLGLPSAFVPPPGTEAYPASMSMDRALRLAPVFAAGRLIASTSSMLPLQQYRKVRDERERMPLRSLFAQPSRVGTLPDWVFRAVTSMVYRGNAVGLVTDRDTLEFPTFIEWVNPDDVSVEDQLLLDEPGSFTRPIWRWRGIELPAEDVVHIPWFTVPGRVWGLSPLGAYASAVTSGLEAHKFLADWFRSGGAPPGTFKNVAKEIKQDEATTVKARLVAAIRSHEPIVYGSDWDYNSVTVSIKEAEFVQTMRLGATEIAAVYGIPPEMIGGETGGSYTYSSPEQRQIEFIQFSLMPWITKLEAAFSTLLPRTQFVKFNVDALIRTDATVRFRNYKIAREIGLNNVDELRALEDEAPLPNGQGQAYTPLPLLPGASESAADSGPGESADPEASPGDRQFRLVKGEGS